MLTECPAEEVDRLLQRWVGRSLPRRVKAHWLAQASAPEDEQPRLYADNLAAPQAVLRLIGNSCTVHGSRAAVAGALRDLHTGRLRGRTPWPDAAARAAWDKAGARELQLNRVDLSTLAIARDCGWTDPPGEPQPHYCAHAWYIRGRPRFAALVRHSCRVVHGEELFELFRQENHRDEDNYIRACLRSGPSFVCEVGGSPVSWSLTHLGGAIGRIYTPPQHRGQGYAGSMIALQVDTLLALRGIAVASVQVDNAGSYRIFQRLEGRHIRGPMSWSRLRC